MSLGIQYHSQQNPPSLAAASIGIASDLLTLPALGVLGAFSCYKSNFNPSFDEIKKTKKPLVVCLHGNGFNEIQWVFFRYMLGHKYHIVTWNLDGLFTNDHDKGIQDYADLSTKKALELCEKTGYTQFDYVGHSMGCLVAARSAEDLAQKHPSIKVRKLIAISPPWHGSFLLEKVSKITKKCIPSLFYTPKRYREMRGEKDDLSDLREMIAKSSTSYYSICSQGDVFIGQGCGLEGKSPAYLNKFLGHYSSIFSPTVCREADAILQGSEQSKEKIS